MNNENLNSLLTEPLQTETVSAFTGDDMLTCGTCSRKSPPNRVKCIYCGDGLDVNIRDIQRVRLLHRKLEAWEKRWNVVLSPGNETPEPSVISTLAVDLALDDEFAKQVLGQRSPVPVARVETEKEAALWVEKLKSYGVESVVVADEELNVENRPRRVRGIRVLDNGLEFIDFNTMGATSVELGAIRLVVTGRIFTDMSEKLENRRGGKSEAVDEYVSSNDEPVVDIYLDDKIGHRVYATGFDFSFLGSAKTNIAGENCERLVERILSSSRSAKLVDSYRGVRTLLTQVWDVDQSIEFGGPQRSGLRSAQTKRKITRTNLTQFTKFSRLQSHIG